MRVGHIETHRGGSRHDRHAEDQEGHQEHRHAGRDTRHLDRRGEGGHEGAREGAEGERAKADGENDLLAKIAEMPDADRAIAERLHAIIRRNAPSLTPRTYYGMPAYAKDGKVLCFFQPAGKFKARYATLGFDDPANLDDGAMWPTSLRNRQLTATDETRIAALVKQAVG